MKVPNEEIRDIMKIYNFIFHTRPEFIFIDRVNLLKSNMENNFFKSSKSIEYANQIIQFILKAPHRPYYQLKNLSPLVI